MVSCSYHCDAKDLPLVEEISRINRGFLCHTGSSINCQTSPLPALELGASALLSANPIHGVMNRFQHRTAMTFGTASTKHMYTEIVPRLALQHEHLLHAVLATTILHDRALAGSLRPTTTECFHLSRSASLLGQKLSSTIKNEDRDALWATAVYLCAMAIFNVNTSDPEEAWPLRLSHPMDFEWLNMQAGLKVIWNLAQVNRGDGMLATNENGLEANCVYPDPPKSGIAEVPQVLVDLCNLTQESEFSQSPYKVAIQHLSVLLPIEGSPHNILSFMVFAGGMTKEFRELLHEKDHRALLILAVWYSKLFHSAWWMSPRARIECQAICRYLDRLNIRGRAFKVVLQIVKIACLHLDSHAALRLLEQSTTIMRSTRRASVNSTIPDAPTSKSIDIFWDV